MATDDLSPLSRVHRASQAENTESPDRNARAIADRAREALRPALRAALAAGDTARIREIRDEMGISNAVV